MVKYKFHSIAKNDVTQVANLHKSEISQGFLSSLGIKFLTRLYGLILKDKNSFLCIAYVDDVVAGYISATLNIKKLYKKAIMSKFIFTGFLLIPKILGIRAIKKVIQTIIYPYKKNKNNQETQAELLSIVIDPNFRKLGIARELYEKLLKFFKEKNVNKFKVIVGKELDGSRQFYRSMGAIEYKNMSIHTENDSIMFIHNLDEES